VPIDLSDMPQSEDCLYLKRPDARKKGIGKLACYGLAATAAATQWIRSNPVYNLPRLPRTVWYW